MSPEQELLAKWRGLTKDKQEEVLDFVEFLRLKNSANKKNLGERLRSIRDYLTGSDTPRIKLPKEFSSFSCSCSLSSCAVASSMDVSADL